MYLGIEDGFGVALELGEEGDDAKAGVVLEVEFAECHPAVDEQDLAVHQGVCGGHRAVSQAADEEDFAFVGKYQGVIIEVGFAEHHLAVHGAVDGGHQAVPRAVDEENYLAVVV